MADYCIMGIFELKMSGSNMTPGIDVAAYLITAVSVLEGATRATTAAMSRARSMTSLMIGLAIPNGLAKLGPTAPIEFMSAMAPYLTGTEIRPSGRERLEHHLIMLLKIYMSPLEAEIMPELEALGEGRAWESGWRS